MALSNNVAFSLSVSPARILGRVAEGLMWLARLVAGYITLCPATFTSNSCGFHVNVIEVFGLQYY